MVNKNATIFVCSNCDAQFTKWTGKCLECGQWGTVKKSNIKYQKSKIDNDENYPTLETKTLNEIDEKKFQRLQTGIGEFDRVLGGGFVPGSIILLGGEPGIGKSTLALQLAAITSPPPSPYKGEGVGVSLSLPRRGEGEVLYISGEESAAQIKLRAQRLKINSASVRFANATNVESIIAAINTTPSSPPSKEGGNGAKAKGVSLSPPYEGGARGGSKLVIIDSIQTLYSDDTEGAPGNVNQIRACAAKLMEAAKTTDTTIVLIGQVTKDGALSGPKTLEHIVDTVLYLEGDRFHQFRILRAVKNRFGSVDEVGIFEMKETGLAEVKNPSSALLTGRGASVPGSAVTCLMEGTRPLLVEIQALVTKTNFGYPQRRATGFDLNRLQLLIAVLSRRTGLPLESYDVFLNVVGGMQVDEPAADLAVVLAIASAIQNKTLPDGLAAFGEVGLSGETRAVSQTKRRLEEIKKLGFTYAITPPLNEENKIAGLKLAAIDNVKEVVAKIINPVKSPPAAEAASGRI